jgi:hypothetical protein
MLKYQDDHRLAPSLNEMCAGIGVRGNHIVAIELRTLLERGYVEERGTGRIPRRFFAIAN